MLRRVAIEVGDGLGDFRCGRRRQFVGNGGGQAFFASATTAATTTTATPARTTFSAFALLVLRRGLTLAIGILAAIALPAYQGYVERAKAAQVEGAAE